MKCLHLSKPVKILTLSAMLILIGCQGLPPRQSPGDHAPSIDKGELKRAGPDSNYRKFAPRVKNNNEIEIHMLPVGGGMCQVVNCPGNNNPAPLLIDCGASAGSLGANDLSKADAVARTQALLGGRVTTVVLSHSDSDHNNYIPDVFPNVNQVGTLWVGSQFNRYPVAVQTWINDVAAAGIVVRRNFPAGWSNNGNAVLELACGDARTFVLTVNSDVGANDGSMMLSIDHGDTHMIFPGDATKKAQDWAMVNFPNPLLRSDLVAMSHHGADSHGSNDDDWAFATEPRYLFASAGVSYYHPRCDSGQRYINAGRVLAAPIHAYKCGYSGYWSAQSTTATAIYNTEDVGEVVITATDDPATIRVTCSGLACSY